MTTRQGRGYPCHHIQYKGPPFEISLIYRNVMSFCQNCRKEIQADWKRCPFCSVEGSKTKQLGKKLSYLVGSAIVAVSLGLVMTTKYWQDALVIMAAPITIGVAIILNAMMK